MLRFLFRNPSRSLAGTFVAPAGLASVFYDDLRVRARFSFPVGSPSSPLPLFLNQQWSSTGPRLPLVNCSVASPVAPDHSYKDDTDEMEENPECIRGCLGRNAIARAADKAGPAVVSIYSAYRFDGRFISRFIRWYFREIVQSGAIVDPDGPIKLRKGMGSGAIIDPDGTILTCAHLVVDSLGSTLLSKWRKCSDEVEVKLQDGREFIGTVINVDLHSDIAIIKIKSKTPLPYLKIGNSSKLRSGDWVVAGGCPVELQHTFTAGTVSGVDRKWSALGPKEILQEYLQTDCALYKGNLGGPLVNLDGEIVGINVMVARDSYRLSFAVPIESALKIIEHFKKHGRVVRPWLGLEMLDLNDLIIQQHKESYASSDVSKGVQVLMVTPRSPGDRAGFRPGDVIIEFEAKPVKSTKEILEILGDRVGVKMEARVMRANNKEVTLTVVPEEANLDKHAVLFSFLCFTKPSFSHLPAWPNGSWRIAKYIYCIYCI